MIDFLTALTKKMLRLFVIFICVITVGVISLAETTADSFFSGAFAFLQSSNANINRRGDSSFKNWTLPDVAPSPQTNPMNKKRVELGKKLFFDPRVSGNGKMSCATCHNPRLGWSDGLSTAMGHEGKILGRATLTIINTGFNKILMWDGRESSLEEQALGPVNNKDEMANTTKNLIRTLKRIPGYVREFNEAYVGLGINESTIRRSIAMFQRTVVANKSPFDKWVVGDNSAMTASQVRGFNIFINPGKGNCAVCHRPPSFSDDGFHNIGLASFDEVKPDLGRFNQKAVKIARGAFKTPPLRNVTETAPYFHDGSASTLRDVVDHYVSGGVSKKNISPTMEIGKLSFKEKNDLINFLEALTSKMDPELTQVTLP